MVLFTLAVGLGFSLAGLSLGWVVGSFLDHDDQNLQAGLWGVRVGMAIGLCAAAITSIG